MTLNEQLEEILDIKNDIKSSIQSKGQSVTDFASYAYAIDSIDSSSSSPKPSKILVMITKNSESINDDYLEDCTREGEIDVFRTFEYTPNNFTPQDYTRIEINTYDSNWTVTPNEAGIYDDGSLVYALTGNVPESDALTEAFDYLYGSGNYLLTSYTGSALIDYVTELELTYDLTVYEFILNILGTDVHWECYEEPEPEPEEEPEEEPGEGE